MGLSSAIDWWDEWKLRILVLCSMSVQFFLVFSAYVRRSYVLRCLRVIVWLAYIGGDALAVYALATLFNRQKQQQPADGGGGSSALEVIWAPVLLFHLGDQVYITAYSLEDNELWKRHAVTLVSQVTVALYVFCQWWSGATRLLLASVLLFIVGILKFGQKPWALRRASYGNMYFSLSRSPPPRAEEEVSSSRWRLFGKLCIALCTCSFIGDISITEQLEEKARGGGTNYSLGEYVKEAQEHVKQGRKASNKSQREKLYGETARKDMQKMFLDLSAPYSLRLHYLLSFLNLDEQNQHEVLRGWIAMQFLAIYTRLTSTFTCLGLFSILAVPGLVLASVVLFAKSDKDGYHRSDISVTYILFCGMLVIEWAPFFVPSIFILSKWIISRCNHQLGQLGWPDMVAQHNFMSFYARKKQPPTLMKLATTFSYLRHYINKHWYIRHEPAAKQISMLVRHHAEEDGWKEYIRDAATYTRFNNLWGQHTLMKMRPHLLLEQGKLGWTFNLPFDEYVLLWHIATDLCIHHPRPSSETQDHNPITPSRHNSVIISNYMIYLLFICPEMLIPGTRSDMFILACDDIEHIIKNHPLPSPDERSITQRVLHMGQDGNERMKESTMISDAYKLAKVLIDLHNDTQMWEMIQGVWVEMLCYSASKSRGYQHAKSLAYGGEFLTNVWLLWWCMGMQTLPDMVNRLGPQEEQPAADAASV